MNISGSIIVITGASSGLGEAMALAAARRGAAGVALLARRLDRLEALAQRLEDMGVPALALEADVQSETSVEDAVARTLERFGRIDIAVANAGVFKRMSIQRLKAEALGRLFDINVLGAVRLFQAVLPSMLERGSGQLVGISSIIGNQGLPGYGPYGASKAALSLLLEAYRVELSHLGIGVTKVEPGFIKTEMVSGVASPLPFALEAEDAAEQILDAAERGRARFILPGMMRVFVAITRHLPAGLYDRFAMRLDRKRLPKGTHSQRQSPLQADANIRGESNA